MSVNRTRHRPEPARRKPGRIAGPATRKYTLLLEEDLGEWGKRQPGGLSELVRALLRAQREAKGKGAT